MEPQNDPHRPTAPQGETDIVVVGAGLAAAVLALRLAALPLSARILLLEASQTPFGDKTWSFQRTDVAPGAEAWLDHAIAAEWPAQTVRFAELTREIATGYASITSASVARAVAATGRVTVQPGARATRLGPTEVVLEDGARIAARCVIDARGHVPDAAMRTVYQKFVGLRVRLAAPHGIAAPVIMDASVPQIDGFRFVYLLPFSGRDIMIEDTRYADDAALDADAIEAAIHAYAAARGWTMEAVLQRETGVLPVALGFDRHRFWAGASDVPRIGMRGAFFHSTVDFHPEVTRVGV